MKKIFLSIAILASSIAAYAAIPAQTNSTVQTEQTAGGKKAKGDKAKGNKADKADRADRAKERENRLFEGLNLTDAQKTQLQALKDKYKPNREAGQQDGKDRKDRKEMTPEQKEQMRTQRDAAHRSFLADVKAILTPEQYMTFLENNYLLSKGHKHGKAQAAHRGGKKGHDRQGKSADGKNKGDRQGGRDKSRS